MLFPLFLQENSIRFLYMLRIIWQPFYTAFVLLSFVLSVIILFPLFPLLSLGNNQYCRHLIYRIIRGWAIFWLWFTGMRPSYTNNFPAGKKFVIVANHISYLDALLLFPAIPEYFRPLGKSEFSKIPLLGFIYKQIALLVDRGSPASRAKSMKLMQEALKNDNHIMIFPEGTFNETNAPLKEFYDGAFRLAVSAQTDVLPILLPDTVKRWHYSAWWKVSPGSNRVIYLPPVPVAGKDAKELKQEVYGIMEEALKAISSL